MNPEVLMKVLTEFINKSMYNVHGIRIRKLNIPQLRKLLGDGVNEAMIRREIEKISRYKIIAYGGDGSNSSWIFLIDMESKEDLESLRRMCASERILGRIVNEYVKDPAGWVRSLDKLDPGARDAMMDVMKLIINIITPCFAGEDSDINPCIARANLMMLLDHNIIASLANMKVRVVNDPCSLVNGA